MNDCISKGVSFSVALDYIRKHIIGVVIGTLAVAIVTCGLYYARNTFLPADNIDLSGKADGGINEYRKEILDKYSGMYKEFWDKGYNDPDVSSADRIMAAYEAEYMKRLLSEEEQTYFENKLGLVSPDGNDMNKTEASGHSVVTVLILTLGLGAVVSASAALLLCILSRTIPSIAFFEDRYHLDVISWSDKSGEQGENSVSEMLDVVVAMVNAASAGRVLITGSFLDETDHFLVQMISQLLEKQGVTVTEHTMDNGKGDFITDVSKAEMIVIIEHLGKSDTRLTDAGIRTIREYAGDTPIKAIMRTR